MPLLKIALELSPPCMMHCFMAVLRKLSEVLVADICANVAEGQKKIMEVMEKLSLRVYIPREDKETQKETTSSGEGETAQNTPSKKTKKLKKSSLTFPECWAKSRWGRPEWIKILKNIQKLWELLPEDQQPMVCILNTLFQPYQAIGPSFLERVSGFDGNSLCLFSNREDDGGAIFGQSKKLGKAAGPPLRSRCGDTLHSYLCLSLELLSASCWLS